MNEKQLWSGKVWLSEEGIESKKEEEGKEYNLKRRRGGRSRKEGL